MTFKKLFIKGIFLVTITFILLQIIGSVIDRQVPYYWANTKYNNNLKNINEEKNAINTLFVGSSFTLTGINPMLFDSLTNNKSNSINLGWELCVIPETLYWLDNFIDHYPTNKDKDLTIFFELNKVHPISKHENTNRFYYMLNTNSFNILWESINKRKASFLDKFKLRTNLIQGFAINYFSIGILSDKLKYRFFETPPKPKDDLRSSRGYRAANKSLNKRDKKPFKKYLNGIKANRKIRKETYPYLVNYTNELLQKAKTKNIDLIFYTMPGVIDPPVKGLIQALNTEKILDFCQPNSILFDMENRKNFGHLNNNGATILTNLVAEEYLKRMKND